ncbi:MAG TPA: pilus assembly protein PilP [Anaeromyxobacter sp.]|nr:pilus assembly protein PilP [Anaeromyxobacter sp.]
MSTRVLALAVAAVLFGCGSSKRPVVGANVPAKTVEAASAAAAPAAKGPEAEPAYSGVGKRDPFRSFLAEMGQENAMATRCRTPLGRYDIEQFKLVAVITGLEDPVAMVEAPTGVGYTVRKGACIGKNGGVVSVIRSGEVVVSEWAVRADGSRDSTQTVIRLPKPELTTEE